MVGNIFSSVFAPFNAEQVNQACRLASTYANAPGTTFPKLVAAASIPGTVGIGRGGASIGCRQFRGSLRSKFASTFTGLVSHVMFGRAIGLKQSLPKHRTRMSLLGPNLIQEKIT